MPKICCRCNASGRCTNCSCKKSNRKCLNCLQLRQGHCNNPPTAASATPAATAAPDLSLHTDKQDQSTTTSPGDTAVGDQPTLTSNLTPPSGTSPATTSQPPAPMDKDTSTADNTESTEALTNRAPELKNQTDSGISPLTRTEPPPLPGFAPAPHPTSQVGRHRRYNIRQLYRPLL